MLRSIDHIVIVVRDLSQAVVDYERLGFTVTPGGEHTGRDTHNALISFADGTYVELIAFKDPDRPREDDPWWERLRRGEGLVDYALLSDDLEADAAELRRRGLEADGPQDGGRQRPDGQRIAWRTLRLEGSPVLPFVIQDVTPRELRVPGGLATQHKLGVTRVLGLRVAVKDLAGSAAELEQVLGAPSAGPDPDAAGDVTRRHLHLGQQWIELLRAGSDAAVDQQLQAIGPGPFELVLGTHVSAVAGEQGGELLGEGAHGARIRVVR
jgi:hypothetical protein